MELGQKKCWACGRVGTASFVLAIPGSPEWMGPWKCYWAGACSRRVAENVEARERAEPVVEAVDLDAMQDEEG